MHADRFIKVVLVLILVALAANFLAMTGVVKPGFQQAVTPSVALAQNLSVVDPGMVYLTADQTGRTVYTWRVDETYRPHFIARDVAAVMAETGPARHGVAAPAGAVPAAPPAPKIEAGNPVPHEPGDPRNLIEPTDRRIER